jgi:predicted Kef-type K+ transport protein
MRGGWSGRVDTVLEVIVLIVTLLAGLLARTVGLPPMLGFLVAGFALVPLQQFWPGLATINFQPWADIGITLLLFTIGLKLELRSLLRPFVWAVNCLHMSLMILFIAALLFGLKTLGWVLLADLAMPQALTIGFALSFSSTVFAVKVLEERGEMASLHGKTAVGILVMQDFFAVAYLTAIGDSWPSMYAPLLLLLIPARGILLNLLKRCGHGELLVLAGFAIAYMAYALFEWVALKGGLGALFVGALLAGSDKGNELVKALLTIKDLLLIGFFLSIGQYGLPSADVWLMALLLTLLLFIKPLLYFLLLAGFQLRTQTALFCALALNHYSEFGLIVASIAVQQKSLPEQWLVILALALSFSFVISSIINLYGDRLHARWHLLLARVQTPNRVAEQRAIDIGNAKILVMGMGRIGGGAYDYLQAMYGDAVLGFEENEQKVVAQVKAGRRVLVGDAGDRDLWQRLPHQKIEKVILTLNNHRETMQVTQTLRECGYAGVIAAVAKFEDDLQELKAMGVIAFNFYAEAGAGFAEHVVAHLNKNTMTNTQEISS